MDDEGINEHKEVGQHSWLSQLGLGTGRMGELLLASSWERPRIAAKDPVNAQESLPQI